MGTPKEDIHNSQSKLSLLICDDSSLQRTTLQKLLSSEFRIVCAKNADEGLSLLASQRFELLLLDISMRSELEGLEYLPQLRAEFPELGIVISSHHTEYEFVRRALTEGADDFLSKEANVHELKLALYRALEFRKLKKGNLLKSNEILRRDGRQLFVGVSKPIVELRRSLEKLRDSKVNVIIQGESGTGKELVARSLRGYDLQGNLEPFVSVDSSTIQSALAESLLFGHEKGAFTGADRSKSGLFEEAEGGSIYFDEIANMPLEIQRKLLRVVQEKELVRMGSNQVRKLNFRVISATNQDLEDLVQRGTFQFDLLYRLSVVTLEVPPLRERREDIPILIDHYLETQTIKTNFEISSELKLLLCEYEWPGNVRELYNVLSYLATMSEGKAGVEDLPSKILKKLSVRGEVNTKLISSAMRERLEPIFLTGYQDSMRRFEREFMIRAYQNAKGNIAKMSRDIGLDRSYLYSKLRALDLFPIEKLKELSL